jgi:hypothetical protein
MYNPATQVQISRDANLGSYYLEKKITVGDSLTVFLSKKNHRGCKYLSPRPIWNHIRPTYTPYTQILPPNNLQYEVFQQCCLQLGEAKERRFGEGFCILHI